MSEPAMHAYPNRETLDAALAKSIAATLEAAILERGRALIALSGGSTPRGLLTRLRGLDLAWNRITVTLVDERWVDGGHADSNARMVRETLLQGAAAAAHFQPLYSATDHPREAVEDLEARFAPLGACDIVILGMGGDGHFASLFPESEALLAGLDLGGQRTFIAVDPPVAPHPRMSMTLRRITNTRHLLLHITGEEKREVLERAAAEDPRTLPIAAVLALSEPRVDIHWAP